MCRIWGAPRNTVKQRISRDEDSGIGDTMEKIVSVENSLHIPMRHTTLHLHACSVPLHISYRATRPRKEQYSPLEGLNQPVCLALNLKNLYCFIRRACRQSAAIVIQTGIVLNQEHQSVPRNPTHKTPHNIHRIRRRDRNYCHVRSYHHVPNWR